MKNTNKDTSWLEKRLKELGKKNYELADVLGLQHNKISQIKAGSYNFQPEHLSSVAEFLNFDKGAFIDFIAGKIDQQKLWDTQPIILTDQDRAILNAVKTATGLQKQNENNTDSPKQVQVSDKER